MDDALPEERLFVYGSLQLDAVFEAVTGRRPAARRAVLQGHRRRRLRDRSYPGVRADASESTDGALIVGLGAAELSLLDRFEGEPYRRLRVEVDLGDGRLATAFAYVIDDAHQALMTDEPWDLADFRHHHLPGFLEQCRRFRDELRSGAARGDVDWRGPD